MLIFILLMAIAPVFSMVERTTYDFNNLWPECREVCSTLTLPKLELEDYEQVVCQRGCHLLELYNYDDSPTQACHKSCTENYIEVKERNICIMGCDAMAKKHNYPVMDAIVLSKDQDTNVLVLAEPDMEVLESELADPMIRGQIEVGFNIDYKIPETHIRTMPIDASESNVSQTEKGDWFYCASKSSGIPRWMMLGTIVAAIVVALWLVITSRHVEEEVFEQMDVVEVSVKKHPGDIICKEMVVDDNIKLYMDDSYDPIDFFYHFLMFLNIHFLMG